MDASYTGNKISQLRKQNNMTQKELAELLFVTDKAVSKWERGMNFPDLMTLEKVARIFDTSVLELLGIERHTNEQVVAEIADIANSEKQSLLAEIRWRDWLNVIIGMAIYFCYIYISKQLYDRQIYGVNVLVPAGFLGIIIGNSILSIRYAGRIAGKHTLLSKFWEYFKKSKFYGVCNSCTIKVGNVLLKIAEKSPINLIIDYLFKDR